MCSQEVQTTDWKKPGIDQDLGKNFEGVGM